MIQLESNRHSDKYSFLTNMFKSFKTILAFTIRDAVISISYKLDFGIQIFSIFFWVVFFYFVSQLVGSHPSLNQYGGYLPFSMIGMAVLCYFQTGYTSFSQAIRSEQMMGTLEAVLMTPVGISMIVIGSSLWNFIWSTLASVLYVICAIFLYGIPLKGSFLLALLLLGLMTLFFASLGVISASFVMVFKKGDPLSFFLGTISSLLGGAFFPVDMFPPWAQKIAYLLPITYSLDALRGVLLKGESFTEILPEFLILTGFTCVFVPVSLYCFQKAVQRALHDGSLLHY